MLRKFNIVNGRIVTIRFEPECMLGSSYPVNSED